MGLASTFKDRNFPLLNKRETIIKQRLLYATRSPQNLLWLLNMHKTPEETSSCRSPKFTSDKFQWSKPHVFTVSSLPYISISFYSPKLFHHDVNFLSLRIHELTDRPLPSKSVSEELDLRSRMSMNTGVKEPIPLQIYL